MKKTQRYELLDILRGLAAFSVVIWHWKHFYFSYHSESIELTNKATQPFYDIIYPLYSFGGIAVDIFFLISGFIFYTLYSQRISNGSISGGYFFLLRFSRLYPLHLATLLIVTLLQYFYFHYTGKYFIYAYNDLYHFILQLFFASSWGGEQGDSFNGPIWSVSIEVVLYAVFFILCKLKLNGARWSVLMLVLALLLPSQFQLIARGLLSFFMGGLCFHALSKLEDKQESSIALPTALITLTTAIILLLITPIWTAAATHLAEIASNTPTSAPLILSAIKVYYLKLLVFPLALINLVLAERHLIKHLKFLTWIGNVTYSSYLLHFPLQLIFVLSTLYLHIEWNFNSKITFIIFFSTLITLSLISYYKFELPVQSIIRKKKIINSEKNHPNLDR